MLTFAFYYPDPALNPDKISKSRTRRQAYFSRKITESTPGSYNDAYVHEAVVVNVGSTIQGNKQINHRLLEAEGKSTSTYMVASKETVSPEAFSGIIHWQFKPVPAYQADSNYPNRNKLDHYGYNTTIVRRITSHDTNTSSMDIADQRSISKLHKKIEQVQHQFQGGVFVAELTKALRMIKRPAATLRNSIDDYIAAAKKRTRNLPLNGSSKNRKTASKIIADTYLEYTFGWQPLLHDVRDAAVAVARLQTKFERKRFKVTGEDEGATASFVSDYTYPINFLNGFVYKAQEKIGGRSKVIYYGMFQGGQQDYPEHGASRLVELSGFDLRSFVPTIWELIPYSFVVDYFTNIGDVLQAYSHATGVVMWITKVNLKESTYSIVLNPDVKRTLTGLGNVLFPFYHDYVIDASQAGCKSSFKTVERIPNLGVPYPALEFKIPGFESRKWLNLGALALGKSPRLT